MSGSATFATARLRFATAATRISAISTERAWGGAVEVSSAAAIAGSLLHRAVGHKPASTAGGMIAAMRAVVQRVSEASVTVAGERVAAIGPGLLVLLGVHREDTEAEADKLAAKLLALRIFADGEGRMNRSVADSGGAILCVSQFTLYGDVRKGNRPSFVDAAPGEIAEPLYERVRAALGAQGGVFGAQMDVALVNDGPVTLVVEV